MSQSQFLGQFDAKVHRALADAGMADAGLYIEPGGGAVPVRAYVDYNLARLGMYTGAVDSTCSITLLRSDVPDPEVGAVVEMDGRSYVLRLLLEQDDGISIWGAA